MYSHTSCAATAASCQYELNLLLEVAVHERAATVEAAERVLEDLDLEIGSPAHFLNSSLTPATSVRSKTSSSEPWQILVVLWTSEMT